jgi:hypothetical protein
MVTHSVAPKASMTRRPPPTNDEIYAATCWNSMAVVDIET